jgi:hypothetical protein
MDSNPAKLTDANASVVCEYHSVIICLQYRETVLQLVKTDGRALRLKEQSNNIMLKYETQIRVYAHR